MSKEYWEELCVPFEEINQERNKHLLRTNIILNRLSQSHLETLNNCFFHVESIQEKDKFIERIIASPLINEFIYLQEFYKGRKQLLNEFFRKPVFSEILEDADFLVESCPLIKIYSYDKEKLIDAILYCEYKKKLKGELLIIKPEWKEEDKTKFEQSILGLKQKVSRKYKRKKFIELRRFSDGESQYYIFHRQKKQKVAMTFGKNVSLTGKSDLFLKFDNGGLFMNIKCGDNSLLDLVVSHICFTCNKTVFYENSEPTSFELSNKVHSLLTETPEDINENDLIVEQASIRKTTNTPRTCIKVGKKLGNDIRHTLKALDTQNICNLNDKSNVSSFHINFKGISIGIKLVLETDDSFKFVFTKGNLPDTKLKEIKDKIKELWGIDIGVSYAPPLTINEKKNLFDKFLDFDGREQLSEEKKIILEELTNKKLIKSKKEKLWKCEDNPVHIFFRTYESCPDCEGHLYICNEYASTHINYLGIKSFIRNILKNKFGINAINEKIRKYRGNSYSFFLVTNNDFKFYIYIHHEKNIEKILPYFKKSTMPTLIISTLKPLRGEVDDSIFENILLKNIYFDETNLIGESAGRLKSNYLARLLAGANESSDSLQEMISGSNNYTYSDLEDDVFNILKYIFKTGEKWGKERSGSTLPEGVIGYSTYHKKRKRGFKSGKVSFIWDCKYHSNNGHYDFDSSEKDKARRYVIQANQSKAIKKFSGKLNAYITFCNIYNLTNYTGFAEKLYKYRTWKGTVILFELSALMKLFNFVKENHQLFEQKYNLFLSEFSKRLDRTNNPFEHITDTVIDEITQEILTSNIPANLDVESLRETFELDEIF